MELSIFLAKLIGISYGLVALVGIFRPQVLWKAVRDFDHESFSALSVGIITLMAGLAVVLAHNIWNGTWVTWITFFGWAGFVKGVMYVAMPASMISMGRSVIKNHTVFRLVLIPMLILSIYLTAKGFGY
jgi:hypothetical protein